MGFYEDHLNKQLQEKEQEQRLFEQIKEQLRTEEPFVNFFKPYNPTSIEQFIEFYATRKVQWLRYAGNFEHYAAQKLQRDRKQVVDLLEHIMVKKLFNLKCRWVAGEMDLEGVEMSCDFNQWRKIPALLKAAGPITADEFYCYLDYYREGSPERLDEYGDPEGSSRQALHHYHDSRSRLSASAGNDIPDWFHRYDSHFGTAHLLHLPTTRTDIELDHFDDWNLLIHIPSLSPEIAKNLRPMNRAIRARLAHDAEFNRQWMEENERLHKERQGDAPKYEHFSIHNRTIMDEIVMAIETRDVQRMYRDERKWNELRNREDSMFTPVDYLQEVKGYVAIAPHEDHREAIREAYEHHLHQTNGEALELLFEEYEACMRSGQPFDWGENVRDYSSDVRDRILAVRKFKGLPLNFEFLQKKNLP
jgi:hypothetical protein